MALAAMLFIVERPSSNPLQDNGRGASATVAYGGDANSSLFLSHDVCQRSRDPGARAKEEAVRCSSIESYHPRGCPKDTEPPQTFTHSERSPRIFMLAMATELKASFISK